MEYLFGWLAIALFVGAGISLFVLTINFSLFVLYPALNFIFFLIPPKVYTDKEKTRKELKEKEEEFYSKNAWQQITGSSTFLILVLVFDRWFFQIYDWSLIIDLVETFSK